MKLQPSSSRLNSSFFFPFFFNAPFFLLLLHPSLVFVVAAAAEHALHWRSEALCLISSRQTDLWGFIDSKLHRGRHRAGGLEAAREWGGVLEKVCKERGGRKKSGGIDGWRDRRVGREDGERFNVMKQETGRGAERKKPIWGRWGTNAEFSLI